MKKRKIADPYWEREKQKYQKPIASREYILSFLQKYGKPIGFKKLAQEIKIKDDEQIEGLRRRLQAMERDGQLMLNRRGKYCLIDKLELIKGKLEAHPDGYGFVVPQDGSPDLYMPPRQMRGLLHGDIILVCEAPFSLPNRREAIFVELCERTIKQVVGYLAEQNGVWFVTPQHERISEEILIPPHEINGAQPAQIVVVELIPQPSRAHLVGRVIEALGEPTRPGMEIDIAIHRYELPYCWSDEVLAEIQPLKHAKVDATAIQDRKDLRDLPFVTIDGEDAKDFDDAVFCKPRPRNAGWILYVAIADVSYYVNPRSALDRAAYDRGNSVYFPEKVIPMLPEVLSNELCSLKPKVDRLCLVCELSISKNGEIERYRFYDAVIHSIARLTYTKVAKMMAGDKNVQKQLADWQPHLTQLTAVYHTLHQAREKRGAIDFDSTETKILFDEQGKIKQIVPATRNDAHRLIEECMLVANVATAHYLQNHQIPALYRIHVPPDSDRLTSLREFLSEFGLKLKGGEKPRPRHYAELIQQIRTRPDAGLIQTVLLRSMSQAVYSPQNEGHFGLAYEAYTHFTSPIRRYPDLIVHRAIRYLMKHRNGKKYPYDIDEMEKIAEHCSKTERRADEAVRDVVDWLKCEYMQEHIGSDFEGTISSVTSFGLFVMLKDIYIEGLVHVSSLKNDYYHFDNIRHCLIGERTGMIYRLGDPIKIRVARVSLDTKKIDFVLTPIHESN